MTGPDGTQAQPLGVVGSATNPMLKIAGAELRFGSFELFNHLTLSMGEVGTPRSSLSSARTDRESRRWPTS